MSTERTAEEWGRVAVSLPCAPACWDDLEGVDGHDAPGAVCADGTWWSPDSADGMFLDVDHPATEGCLLRLLGGQVTIRRRGQWVVEWRGMAPLAPGFGAVSKSVTGMGFTLGRVCIAAAAAIGRWPGGSVSVCPDCGGSIPEHQHHGYDGPEWRCTNGGGA